MDQYEQNKMFTVLDQQRQQQARIDQIFRYVLPITAFLLCVICANMNWQSTLGTFLVLWLAFYAVVILRMNLYFWMLIVAVYCCIDIYLSYATLLATAMARQMGTMLTFLAIFGLGRPYIDRWLMK